ncbi:helix-turn-helix domain-containing protein [Phenylobacterium sp.]|uniref:helix-turn-helix domain-containing protein n=1 Tax=Phenylobacterium sp. TaxID=1871053 RepID=UPI00271E4598|nr:helix-turn-helix transcriptional regulator [Phenylobacterium sp.]MDO8381000.1 helix-turn-helix transcriptional regulator [Phenylobacterium sp.]
MPIGDKIKEMRVRKGQSLQGVADAIGASKAHIWELESNRSKNPSLDLLQKLASHFGTTVAYLIEEPEGDLSRADQFYRRNSEKFAAMGDKDFDVLEQLLDMIAKREDGRGT